MIFCLVVLAYFVVLWDFNAEYKTKKWKIRIVYNGLLWVILDYILNDKYRRVIYKPIRWITITLLRISNNDSDI